MKPIKPKDMNTIKNLWPATLQLPPEITPLRLLTAQADFLTEFTKGVLTATVTTRLKQSADAPMGNLKIFGEVFCHSLNITAPALGYNTTFLTVRHQPLKIYPLYIYADITYDEHTAKTYEEFEQHLAKIWRKPEVMNGVWALMLQSGEVG
jgi:hypothetical protein